MTGAVLAGMMPVSVVSVPVSARGARLTGVSGIAVAGPVVGAVGMVVFWPPSISIVPRPPTGLELEPNAGGGDTKLVAVGTVGVAMLGAGIVVIVPRSS